MNAAAPAELWSAQESADADRHTMDRLGVPSPLLMERAALCVSHEVVARRREGQGPVVVAVGPGNNGGDGVAVARQLHGWGVPVVAVLATDTHNAALGEQIRIARDYGVTVGRDWPAVADAVVVDALLGTGTRGAPRGAVVQALTRIAGYRGPRIAVDVPTGVDPDSGAAADAAFVADVTVTFARSKPGLHVTPGRRHAGRIVVADIGLQGVPDRARPVSLIDPRWVARRLGAPTAAAHKGQRGHVAVVGGAGGTPGAAVLAGAAAMRTGAGLCTIATPDDGVASQLASARPELMVVSWRGGEVLAAATALVVGPGLTSGAVTGPLEALWRQDTRPAVWDASALDHVPPRATMAGPRVVTPHPGEAARMLTRLADRAWSNAQVQTDRRAAAQALAACTGAIVVLKGEGTIVAHDPALQAINVSGAATLATAGSGDVLAGAIGALLAVGVEAGTAAEAGVYAHGLAGALASVGALASDIANLLGPAMAELRQGVAPPTWPRLRRG